MILVAQSGHEDLVGLLKRSSTKRTQGSIALHLRRPTDSRLRRSIGISMPHPNPNNLSQRLPAHCSYIPVSTSTEPSRQALGRHTQLENTSSNTPSSAGSDENTSPSSHAPQTLTRQPPTCFPFQRGRKEPLASQRTEKRELREEKQK